MQVIVVSGGTATGKTTIARQLSDKLGYPVLCKDDIKDKLFAESSFKPGLRHWHHFEKKALNRFYKKFGEYIQNRQSVIVESNFHHKDAVQLHGIIGNSTYREIYCKAHGWAVIKRYIKRNESGNRHKGHHDRVWYLGVILFNAFGPITHAWNPPMMADATMRLELDTTKFSDLNYAEIIDFIK